MEEFVRERIRKILEEKKTNVTAFAKRNEVNQSKMSKQIYYSTAISLNTILLVLQQYPEVSAEWLLRGNGPMYIPEEPEQVTKEEKRESRKVTVELEICDNEVIKMKLKDGAFHFTN